MTKQTGKVIVPSLLASDESSISYSTQAVSSSITRTGDSVRVVEGVAYAVVVSVSSAINPVGQGKTVGNRVVNRSALMKVRDVIEEAARHAVKVVKAQSSTLYRSVRGYYSREVAVSGEFGDKQTGKVIVPSLLASDESSISYSTQAVSSSITRTGDSVRVVEGVAHAVVVSVSSAINPVGQGITVGNRVVNRSALMKVRDVIEEAARRAVKVVKAQSSTLYRSVRGYYSREVAVSGKFGDKQTGKVIVPNILASDESSISYSTQAVSSSITRAGDSVRVVEGVAHAVVVSVSSAINPVGQGITVGNRVVNRSALMKVRDVIEEAARYAENVVKAQSSALNRSVKGYYKRINAISGKFGDKQARITLTIEIISDDTTEFGEIFLGARTVRVKAVTGKALSVIEPAVELSLTVRAVDSESTVLEIGLGRDHELRIVRTVGEHRVDTEMYRYDANAYTVKVVDTSVEITVAGDVKGLQEDLRVYVAGTVNAEGVVLEFGLGKGQVVSIAQNVVSVVRHRSDTISSKIGEIALGARTVRVKAVTGKALSVIEPAVELSLTVRAVDSESTVLEIGLGRDHELRIVRTVGEHRVDTEMYRYDANAYTVKVIDTSVEITVAGDVKGLQEDLRVYVAGTANAEGVVLELGLGKGQVVSIAQNVVSVVTHRSDTISSKIGEIALGARTVRVKAVTGKALSVIEPAVELSLTVRAVDSESTVLEIGLGRDHELRIVRIVGEHRVDTEMYRYDANAYTVKVVDTSVEITVAGDVKGLQEDLRVYVAGTANAEGVVLELGLGKGQVVSIAQNVVSVVRHRSDTISSKIGEIALGARTVRVKAVTGKALSVIEPAVELSLTVRAVDSESTVLEIGLGRDHELRIVRTVGEHRVDTEMYRYDANAYTVKVIDTSVEITVAGDVKGLQEDLRVYVAGTASAEGVVLEFGLGKGQVVSIAQNVVSVVRHRSDTISSKIGEIALGARTVRVKAVTGKALSVIEPAVELSLTVRAVDSESTVLEIGLGRDHELRIVRTVGEHRVDTEMYRYDANAYTVKVIDTSVEITVAGDVKGLQEDLRVYVAGTANAEGVVLELGLGKGQVVSIAQNVVSVVTHRSDTISSKIGEIALGARTVRVKAVTGKALSVIEPAVELSLTVRAVDSESTVLEIGLGRDHELRIVRTVGEHRVDTEMYRYDANAYTVKVIDTSVEITVAGDVKGLQEDLRVYVAGTASAEGVVLEFGLGKGQVVSIAQNVVSVVRHRSDTISSKIGEIALGARTVRVKAVTGKALSVIEPAVELSLTVRAVDSESTVLEIGLGRDHELRIVRTVGEHRVDTEMYRYDANAYTVKVIDTSVEITVAGDAKGLQEDLRVYVAGTASAEEVVLDSDLVLSSPIISNKVVKLSNEKPELYRVNARTVRDNLVLSSVTQTKYPKDSSANISRNKFTVRNSNKTVSVSTIYTSRAISVQTTSLILQGMALTASRLAVLRYSVEPRAANITTRKTVVIQSYPTILFHNITVTNITQVTSISSDARGQGFALFATRTEKATNRGGVAWLFSTLEQRENTLFTMSSPSSIFLKSLDAIVSSDQRETRQPAGRSYSLSSPIVESFMSAMVLKVRGMSSKTQISMNKFINSSPTPSTTKPSHVTKATTTVSSNKVKTTFLAAGFIFPAISTNAMAMAPVSTPIAAATATVGIKAILASIAPTLGIIGLAVIVALLIAGLIVKRASIKQSLKFVWSGRRLPFSVAIAYAGLQLVSAATTMTAPALLTNSGISVVAYLGGIAPYIIPAIILLLGISLIAQDLYRIWNKKAAKFSSGIFNFVLMSAKEKLALSHAYESILRDSKNKSFEEKIKAKYGKYLPLEFRMKDYRKLFERKNVFWFALFIVIGAAIGSAIVAGWGILLGALVAFASPYLLSVLWNFFFGNIWKNIKFIEFIEDRYDNVEDASEIDSKIKEEMNITHDELLTKNKLHKIRYYFKAGIITLNLMFPIGMGIIKFMYSRALLALVGDFIATPIVHILPVDVLKTELLGNFFGGLLAKLHLKATVAELVRLMVMVMALNVKKIGSIRNRLQDERIFRLFGPKARADGSRIGNNARDLYVEVSKYLQEEEDISNDEKDKAEVDSLLAQARALVEKGILNTHGRPELERMLKEKLEEKFGTINKKSVIKRAANQFMHYVVLDVAAIIITLIAPLLGVFTIHSIVRVKLFKKPIESTFIGFLSQTGKEFWVGVFHMWIISMEIGVVLDVGEELAAHPQYSNFGGTLVNNMLRGLEDPEVGAMGIGQRLVPNEIGPITPQAIHELLGGTNDVAADQFLLQMLSEYDLTDAYERTKDHGQDFMQVLNFALYINQQTGMDITSLIGSLIPPVDETQEEIPAQPEDVPVDDEEEIIEPAPVTGEETKNDLFKDYIRRNEGYRSKIYQDTKGYNTIGWGFNLDFDWVKEHIPADVADGTRDITAEESRVIFDELYDIALERAHTFIGGKDVYESLPASVQQVLVDMAYNIKPNSFLSDGYNPFKQFIVTGDFASAAEWLTGTIYAQEVGRRAVLNATLLKEVSEEINIDGLFQPYSKHSEDIGRAIREAWTGTGTFEKVDKDYVTALHKAFDNNIVEFAKLIRALMSTESSFNPNAVSPKGAVGLIQVMPATWKGIVSNILKIDASETQNWPTAARNDPYKNVIAGIAYFAQQLETFGNISYAVAAYNAGPGSVKYTLEKYGRIPHNGETEKYVPKVMSRYQDASLINVSGLGYQYRSGHTSTGAPIETNGVVIPDAKTILSQLQDAEKTREERVLEAIQAVENAGNDAYRLNIVRINRNAGVEPFLIARGPEGHLIKIVRGEDEVSRIYNSDLELGENEIIMAMSQAHLTDEYMVTSITAHLFSRFAREIDQDVSKMAWVPVTGNNTPLFEYSETPGENDFSFMRVYDDALNSEDATPIRGRFVTYHGFIRYEVPKQYQAVHLPIAGRVTGSSRGADGYREVTIEGTSQDSEGTNVTYKLTLGHLTEVVDNLVGRQLDKGTLIGVSGGIAGSNSYALAGFEIDGKQTSLISLPETLELSAVENVMRDIHLALGREFNAIGAVEEEEPDVSRAEYLTNLREEQKKLEYDIDGHRRIQGAYGDRTDEVNSAIFSVVDNTVAIHRASPEKVVPETQQLLNNMMSAGGAPKINLGIQAFTAPGGHAILPVQVGDMFVYLSVENSKLGTVMSLINNGMTINDIIKGNIKGVQLYLAYVYLADATLELWNSYALHSIDFEEVGGTTVMHPGIKDYIKNPLRLIIDENRVISADASNNDQHLLDVTATKVIDGFIDGTQRVLNHIPVVEWLIPDPTEPFIINSQLFINLVLEKQNSSSEHKIILIL